MNWAVAGPIFVALIGSAGIVAGAWMQRHRTGAAASLDQVNASKVVLGMAMDDVRTVRDELAQAKSELDGLRHEIKSLRTALADERTARSEEHAARVRAEAEVELLRSIYNAAD